MKNKFLSLLLIISMLSGVCSFSVSAGINSGEDKAFATLGASFKSQNFQNVKVGAAIDNKHITERGGRGCWIIDKANGIESSKICMTLTDSFKSGVDSGDAYMVEVDYFDVEKGGFFFLGYDGQRPLKLNEECSQAGDVIYTKGEQVWKTASFRIDDAKFQKGLAGGCDLYIDTSRVESFSNADYLSQTPVPFGEIRITRYRGVNPIRNVVAVDNTGNAFSWFEENKIIHNTFTNLKNESISVDITFELVSPDGFSAYSETEKLSFEAKETKTIDFNFGEFQRCDRYSYFVNVKNQELGINSRVQYSVVAIIKTDPDGIMNEHMGVSDLGYRDGYLTPYEHMLQGNDLIKLGNFSGIRYDEGTSSRVPVQGVFSTGIVKDKIVDEATERDMSILPIFYVSGGPISDSWDRFPETDAQFEAGAEAMEQMVMHLRDKTDTYETWNEPDIPYFARNFTAERLFKVLSLTHNAVQKHDPEAKLGFLCYAGAEGQDRHEYTTKMLEWGLGDMIRNNAISFHGYPTPTVEGYYTTSKIQWYIDELEKFGVDRSEYEVWITEFGATIADAHVGTRKRQGAISVREALLARTNLGVEKFWVHRMDDPGSVDFQREASFGMCSSPQGYDRVWGQVLVPWESFIMITGYNYLFADSKPSGKVIDEENLKVYRFQSNKFSKDIISINTVRNAESVTLDLGVKEVQYFDEYANEKTVKSDNGIYTFTATEYPHYIMGNFRNAKKAETEGIIVTDAGIEAVAENTYTLNIENKSEKELKLTVEVPIQEKADLEFILKPGRNKIQLKNPALIGEKYEIRLNVKDNEDYVAVRAVEVESVAIAVTELVMLPKTLNNWQGRVRIGNVSDTKVLRGKFEIVSPENLKPKAPVEVSFIPTGKSAEITFDLPEIVQKKIYTVEYKLSLDSGEILPGKIKVDTTCADYAKNKPVIDGKMDKDEWNVQTLMQTDSADNIAYNTGWTGKQWKGPDDQSAKAYAMWDEERVYFCWDVKDDVFSQDFSGSETWNGDSVQIGIYMGNNDEYVAYGDANTTFTEIGIAKTPRGLEAYRFSAQDSKTHSTGQLNDDQFDLAVNVQGNKTIYEFSMPWSELLPQGAKPKAGSRLGFSFLVNENDGYGRQGAIMFASGIFYKKDSTLFTYLNLIAE